LQKIVQDRVHVWAVGVLHSKACALTQPMPLQL